MGRRRVLAVRIFGPVALAAAVVAGGMAPASAAPTTVPAPVQRLAAAAGHDLRKVPAPAAERRALTIPGEGDTYVEIVPGCAAGKGKAKVNAIVLTSDKLKLDYVLTGTGLRKAGTVKTRAGRTVSVKLPSVHAGSYRLTLALHGKTALVADETFAVRPCVVVKASCRAVTFTNPAGSPAAYVSYRGHHRNQEFDLDLAPGRSRTVRADYSAIDYDAVTSDEDYAGLDQGKVKVKQHCSHGLAQPADNAVQTTGLVGCSGTGPATVSLGWSVQPSVGKRRYEVLDAHHQVAAQGSFKGGHHADVSLEGGSYTYRSYANGLAEPFEDVAFVVLDCVQVTPRCQAIDVRNPNAVPVVVLPLQTDDDPGEGDDGGQVTVGAGTTVTIPWHSAGVWVLAFADDGSVNSTSPFFSVASAWPFDEEPEQISVPQNC